MSRYVICTLACLDKVTLKITSDFRRELLSEKEPHYTKQPLIGALANGI